MARGLDGDVDRLAAARRVDDVLEVARHRAHERLGQLGARDAREVVVADVERPSRLAERGHDLRVAVAQVEDAAVQVEVEQLAALEVPDAVALAAADHEVDAERAEGPHPIRTDVARRQARARAASRRSSLLLEHLRRLHARELDHHGREVARHPVSRRVCIQPRPSSMRAMTSVSTSRTCSSGQRGDGAIAAHPGVAHEREAGIGDLEREQRRQVVEVPAVPAVVEVDDVGHAVRDQHVVWHEVAVGEAEAIGRAPEGVESPADDVGGAVQERRAASADSAVRSA